ncbi:hypothetical protein [Henriciella mobilis]|nr:hypothetical protein [Henriciella mobilis]
MKIRNTIICASLSVLALTACDGMSIPGSGSSSPSTSAETTAVAEPEAPAPEPRAAETISLDFSTPTELTFEPEQSYEDAVVEGELLLLPMHAVKSVQTMAVRAGDAVKWSTTVHAVQDPTNGLPNNFFIGPIGLNAAGEVVQWWPAHDPITVQDGEVTLQGEWIAGESVETVQIGLHGNWAENQPPAGDGVIAVSDVEITRPADE